MQACIRNFYLSRSIDIQRSNHHARVFSRRAYKSKNFKREKRALNRKRSDLSSGLIKGSGSLLMRNRNRSNRESKVKQFLLKEKDQASERKERVEAPHLRFLDKNPVSLVMQKGVRNRLDVSSGVLLEKYLEPGSMQEEESVLKKGKENIFGERKESKISKEADAMYRVWLEERRAGNPEYLKLQEARKKLPAYTMKDEICEVVRSNQVTIISGATGCGKTTQIPQILLDDMVERENGHLAKIICTQPRRLATTEVSRRIAAERGEELGKTVGYKIRLDQQKSDLTQLLLCTTGVLLSKYRGNPNLAGISHVIVDEVHERSLDSDLLLVFLKSVVEERPDIRVVLMSATFKSSEFSDYFSGAPVVEIPGRTFPIETMFLEDVVRAHPEFLEFKGNPKKMLEPPPEKDSQLAGREKNIHELVRKDFAGLVKKEKLPALVAAKILKLYALPIQKQFETIMIAVPLLVEKIANEAGPGGILVFVKGQRDLKDVHDRLRLNPNLSVHKLHSAVPTSVQKLAFDPPPPGKRKVVVATNIAESSITINDVVHVVDTCQHKEAYFDQLAQVKCLDSQFVSKASCLQRRGRAGRNQPGTCYHLIAKAHFEELPAHRTPEIQRISLESTCMSVRKMGVASEGAGGLESFLKRSITPPDSAAVTNAVGYLEKLGAFEKGNEKLTVLGHRLSDVPMHPRYTKALLLSLIFGCFESVLTIVSFLEHKSPFPMLDMDAQSRADSLKRDLCGQTQSDLFALLQAYNGWRTYGARFAAKHLLDFNVLHFVDELREKMKNDFRYRMGLDNSNYEEGFANDFEHSWPVIKACLLGGLFPNVARIDPGRSKKARCNFFSPDHNAKLLPDSVNFNFNKKCFWDHRWLFFCEHLCLDGMDLILDSTPVSPLPLLLFGSGSSETAQFLGNSTQNSLKVAHTPLDLLGVQELTKDEKFVLKNMDLGNKNKSKTQLAETEHFLQINEWIFFRCDDAKTSEVTNKVRQALNLMLNSKLTTNRTKARKLHVVWDADEKTFISDLAQALEASDALPEHGWGGGESTEKRK